jgi:putative methionine-R-sulfoxide reductase with GAF domain
MDPRPNTDKKASDAPAAMTGLPGPGTAAKPARAGAEVRFPGEDGGKSLAEMAQRDLTATLQLLAERAQYITGATGAAIALRDQDEMVCRASAGRSAPEVGALLQVNSGLSGESVRTQQTLRCDDAFVDPRVNRESCEALGIRSVVVMPLIRGGEVIGVFELFSDKARIFEVRDLVALERMGTMVHTALEHSAAALGLPPMLGEVIQPARGPQDSGTLPAPPREKPDRGASGEAAHPSTNAGEERAPEEGNVFAPARAGLVFHARTPASVAPAPGHAGSVAAKSGPGRGARLDNEASVAAGEDDVLEAAPHAAEARSTTTPGYTAAPRGSFEALLAGADPEPILSDADAAEDARPAPAVARFRPAEAARMSAPEATEVEEEPVPLVVSRGGIASLKQCRQCGFPVSEGRTLCLDCEKKAKAGGASGGKSPAAEAASREPVPFPIEDAAEASDAPSFLGGAEGQASWLSTHKFMVIAGALALVGIAAMVALR